jgi:uncharacterized protein with HEPN domain
VSRDYELLIQDILNASKKVLRYTERMDYSKHMEADLA